MLALSSVPMVLAGVGNDAPSGKHYNLNLIGKDKDNILPDDSNSGHRIFVNLYGHSTIKLEQGADATDFAVVDADATDGEGKFRLPANPFNCIVGEPDPAVDGTECSVPEFQAYTVWARAVGKPGGNSTTTTCAYDNTDPLNPVLYCSTEQMVLVRTTGKSKFVDYTKELTTIYVDIDADGMKERVGIFDPALEGYFWDYDNNGLKIVQLRFYPVEPAA